MKFRTILLLSALFSGLYGQGSKKIVKIGCIDIQKVVDEISSDSMLKKVVMARQSEFLREAEVLAQEIKKLKDILNKEEGVLPSDRVNSIREEIIFKEKKLKDELEQKSSALQRTENTQMYKLLQNIYDVIKEVALEEGYSMILEKGTSVIYVDPDIDITDLVLDKVKEEKKKVETE